MARKSLPLPAASAPTREGGDAPSPSFDWAKPPPPAPGPVRMASPFGHPVKVDLVIDGEDRVVTFFDTLDVKVVPQSEVAKCKAVGLREVP